MISPEAASSILWRDGTKAQEAATSMKITAQDMLRFGVIDSILREPAGGAHRDPNAMIATTGDAIALALNDLRNLAPDTIRKQRRQNSSISAENWAEVGISAESRQNGSLGRCLGRCLGHGFDDGLSENRPF